MGGRVTECRDPTHAALRVEVPPLEGLRRVGRRVEADSLVRRVAAVVPVPVGVDVQAASEGAVQAPEANEVVVAGGTTAPGRRVVVEPGAGRWAGGRPATVVAPSPVEVQAQIVARGAGTPVDHGRGPTAPVVEVQAQVGGREAVTAVGSGRGPTGQVTSVARAQRAGGPTTCGRRVAGPGDAPVAAGRGRVRSGTPVAVGRATPRIGA